jgi:predicted metal-dependent phosphotriesterase family hydrolase
MKQIDAVTGPIDFENALPALRKAGVNDAQVVTMMVANPRRFLTGE